MTDDPLDDYELVFLLGLAFQEVLGSFVHELDGAGYGDLRPVHGFALLVIVRTPDLTSSLLAEKLGVTKQAAGQLVDHLVKRGYVDRAEHPLGGRRRSLVLTPKGAEHMRQAGRLLRDVERNLSSGISAEHRAEFRNSLIAVVRAAIPAPEVPPLRPQW